jgi:hypothetical protein
LCCLELVLSQAVSRQPDFSDEETDTIARFVTEWEGQRNKTKGITKWPSIAMRWRKDFLLLSTSFPTKFSASRLALSDALLATALQKRLERSKSNK